MTTRNRNTTWIAWPLRVSMKKREGSHMHLINPKEDSTPKQEFYYCGIPTTTRQANSVYFVAPLWQ